VRLPDHVWLILEANVVEAIRPFDNRLMATRVVVA
jgi:hypothetical protein